MFEIKTISDDEIDYFDELKSNNNDIKFADFILSREGIEINDDVSFEIKKTHRVTANIATQPKRFEKLILMLESIEGQFDEIRIYLNNYEYIPCELSKYTTKIGKDLTDNGKFFWSENENEYYFSLDDDIIYPEDYVEKTLPLIGNRIISYHGRRLTGKNKNYYLEHKTYMFDSSNHKIKKLDLVGTGVMAFDTDIFKPTLWKSPNYRMTDLIVSLEANIYGIPMICPKKKKNWLGRVGIDIDGIYTSNAATVNGLCNNYLFDQTILTTYSDMIQTLIKSNIDLKKINYHYSDKSILELSNFIKEKISNEILINLRSGNGYLIENISKLTDILCISYDTDDDRIKKCNLNNLNSKVDYRYLNQYTDLSMEEKDCFILFDDLTISSSVSTKIYNKLKIGSHLICHNFVNNVFPDDKIVLKLNDGQEVEFYYYFKK